MCKKKMIFFGEDVNLLISMQEFLEKLEKVIDLKSFAPDPLKILECIEDEIIDFQADIIIFLYPNEKVLGEDLHERVEILVGDINMEFFTEESSLKLFLKKEWSIENNVSFNF